MKAGAAFLLAVAMLSMHANALAFSVSDQWIIKDIARKTDTSPCFVRQALGDNFFIAAQQYDMSRTSRERIRGLVRQYYDALRAERLADKASQALLDTCAMPRTI